MNSSSPGRPLVPSRCCGLLTCAALLAASNFASAGTSQGTFVVTASVVAVCQMSASALKFPNYLPGTGSVLHATATISIQCSSGTINPTLALNAGSSGGSMSNRLMLGPAGSQLQYNLFTSATYGTVLGDGTGGSITLPVTIPANAFTTPVLVNVYGQLLDTAANRTAAAGTYSDTVTATLTY